MKLPRLTIEEKPEATIAFKLRQFASDNSVSVEAKHSDDASWQTLIEIGYDDAGHLELRSRDIHTPGLLAALGVEPLHGITTRFVSKSLR